MGSTGLMSARPEKTAAAASSYASTLSRLTGIDWASRLDRRSFHSSCLEPRSDFNRPLGFGSRSTLIAFPFELVMKSFHLTPRHRSGHLQHPLLKARYVNLVGASMNRGQFSVGMPRSDVGGAAFGGRESVFGRVRLMRRWP